MSLPVRPRACMCHLFSFLSPPLPSLLPPPPSFLFFFLSFTHTLTLFSITYPLVLLSNAYTLSYITLKHTITTAHECQTGLESLCWLSGWASRLAAVLFSILHNNGCKPGMHGLCFIAPRKKILDCLSVCSVSFLLHWLINAIWKSITLDARWSSASWHVTMFLKPHWRLCPNLSNASGVYVCMYV